MKKNTNLKSWIILASLVLVWGSSFILIKRSLLYFSATEVGILRITITFLFLLPIALLRLKKINKKHRNYLILSGVIGSFIPAFMFAIAQTGITSSLAGILNSLTPLFTLFLGLAFFKLKSAWYNILGVFIGLAGAMGLIYVTSGEMGLGFNIKYASLVILATICYAFNVNFIKKYFKELDSLTITAFTFFYIGIPSLAYVIMFSNIPSKLLYETDALTGLGYISVLSIAGTGIALIAFNKLIKISSPVFAASVTYLIPVVAIVWGIIDGEIFKLSYIIWFMLILTGVLLVNTTQSKAIFVASKLLFLRKKKN